jgi:hypothetical protein
VAFAAPADGSPATPSAPRAVHAVAAPASANIAWTKPVHSGTAPITKYVVTSAPGHRTCTTTKLTCRVAGLKNATVYRFSVVAFNKHGGGVRSAASNKVTPRARAASVRVLVVTPSSGLTNGESVKVSGSGFTPHDSVFLLECLATATSQSGCSIQGIPTPITITPRGLLPPTTFKVVTGTIGTGKCGTSAANAGACAISVGNASGGDTSTAVIRFKP